MYKGDLRNMKLKITIFLLAMISFLSFCRAEELKFPPYHSVANAPQIKGKATGFFYAKKMEDGRYWLIDPEGNGMVSIGIDHCNYRGHFAFKENCYPYRNINDAKYMTDTEKAAVVGQEHIRRKELEGMNPPDYAKRWAKDTVKQLREWGFNSLGSTCDEQLTTYGLVSRPLLRMTEAFAKRSEEHNIAPYLGKASTIFPNVFHPDFAKHCDSFARRTCAQYKDNPWFLGYYIDNELAWWGRNKNLPVGLFDLTMQKNSTHSAKIALRNFMEKEFNSNIAGFNACWGTQFNNFDDILQLKSLVHKTDKHVKIKEKFLKLIAENYFKITTEAIRKYDPNHLILGCRFAGTYGAASPEVWRTAGKYCDILTINIYPFIDMKTMVAYTDYTMDVTVHDEFNKLYQYATKPFLITEWSFTALDSGVPCTFGSGQRFLTQKERSRAAESFAKMLLAEKFILGYDYFMWCDEPPGGIIASFPENCNYGLINYKGEPYKDMTEMFTKLHQDPASLRLANYTNIKAIAPTQYQDTGKIASYLSIGAKNKAKFTINNNEYSLSNGNITLKGKIGGTKIFDSIINSNGVECSASMSMHVKNRDNISQYCKIKKISAVKGKNLPNGAVELLVSIETQQGLVKIKVVLSANGDFFMTEFVSYTNLIKSSVKAAGFVFHFEPGQNYSIGKKQVYFVWNYPEIAYFTDSNKNYLAAAAYPNSPCRVIFYKVKDNIFSDAIQNFTIGKRDLGYNESYTLQGKSYPFFYFLGNGEEKDIIDRAKETIFKVMNKK